jgi:gentisate 1,2-dioxygenase
MAQSAATADPKRPDPKHNVAGARQAYYDRISKFNMAPLWEKLRQLVGTEPKNKSPPAIERYADVRALVTGPRALKRRTESAICNQ